MGLMFRRVREFFRADNLTLEQVIRRSRIAFVVFVLGLATIVQWSSSYQRDQHLKDAKTNRVLAATNGKLVDDERTLKAVADRLERQRQKIAHDLALVAFDACTKRNEQRDRLVFIVAGTDDITKAQVSAFRRALGFEKCPPKPPPLPIYPAPAVIPRTITTRHGTTTTRATTTTRKNSRPQDTRPDRRRRPKDRNDA
jgi:hypothetical protein